MGWLIDRVGQGNRAEPEKMRLAKLTQPLPENKHTTHLGREIGFTLRSGRRQGAGSATRARVTPQSARVRAAVPLQGGLTFSINSQLAPGARKRRPRAPPLNRTKLEGGGAMSAVVEQMGTAGRHEPPPPIYLKVSQLGTTCRGPEGYSGSTRHRETSAKVAEPLVTKTEM